MRRKKFYAALVASMMAASVAVATPAVARTQTEGCLPEIGKQPPVTLVHGLQGEQDDWEESGFNKNLGAIPGVAPEPFDYADHSTQWVDHPEIGPKLANDIACKAASSRAAGGPGKVIVVNYSMGGLATRFAANQVVNGRKVSDDIDYVINVASPHQGSHVAGFIFGAVRAACQSAVSPFGGSQCRDRVEALDAYGAMQVNSGKLKELPALPESIPVLNIAGHVKQTVVNFLGVRFEVPTQSDLVVSLTSALTGSRGEAQGGGSVTIECTGSLALPVVSDANCEHTKLLANPQVQQAVVGGIQRFLAWKQEQEDAKLCPSASEFENLLYQYSETRDGAPTVYTVEEGPVCQDGVAAAVASDSIMGPSMYILHYQGGVWRHELGGHFVPQATCDTLPPKIRAFLDTKDWCA